ncbi:MAG: hypothetical protein RG741_01470 [Bacteroidales bacterium]|nr:hypothetical protein [Bacteroidales bacterium]
MKTSFKAPKVLFGIIAALILFVGSCEKMPFDGVKLLLDFNIIDTQIGVIVVDAKTGEAITTGNLSVNITGPDKDRVMDINGEETIKVANGIANLTLKSGTNPSAANPVSFTVVGKAQGYLSNSESVMIPEHGGYLVYLRLTSINDLPQGSSGIVDSSIKTSASGVTSGTVVIETPVISSTGTMASLTIKEGTTILDANGNPLSGTINSTVVNFANQDDAAMQSFPGGFSMDAEMTGGETENITMVTAGFIAITMVDEQGNVARNFDPPMEVYMEIPAGTTDENDDPIGVGTVIPVWSYDESTGQWTQESFNAVVQGNTKNGDYFTAFEVAHLSWWNLDWFWNNCRFGATLTFNATSGACGASSVWVEMRRTNGSYLSGRYMYLNSASHSFTLLNVPQNTAVDLIVRTAPNAEPLNSIFIPDLCSGNYTIDFDLAGLTQPVTATFIGRCPDNPDIEIRPSASGWYRKAAGGPWQIAYVWEGEITLCLEQNTPYIFGVVFDGQWYQYEFTSTQSTYVFDLDLTEDICSSL